MSTRRLTIEKMQDAAKQRGGKCISEIYTNGRTPLKWECSKGHIWEVAFQSIRQGHWCPHCAGIARLTIEDARQCAKNRGGKCLSKSYINNSTLMDWKCSQDHSFQSTLNSVRNGHWCSKCGGTARLTIEKMREIAKKNNGECLSEVYINGQTPLKWRCSEGHVWKTPYLGVINKGAWCPVCGMDKLSDPRKYNIKDLQEQAEKRGGKCLSAKFTNIMHRYLWECKKGHQWDTTANTVMNTGTWCPECGKVNNYTETRCRRIVEKLTGLEFSSTRKVLPKRYELDMYNPKYKMAFEYDGEQHSEYKPQWHRTKQDFAKQQERDIFKNDICTKMGIKLERISHKVAQKGDKHLTGFIRQKLIENGIPLKGENNEVNSK